MRGSAGMLGGGYRTTPRAGDSLGSTAPFAGQNDQTKSLVDAEKRPAMIGFVAKMLS